MGVFSVAAERALLRLLPSAAVRILDEQLSAGGSGAYEPSFNTFLGVGLDNGAQSIPSSGQHDIAFDTIEVQGTDLTGLTAEDPAAITVAEDGLYRITFEIDWSGSEAPTNASGQLVFTPDVPAWDASATQSLTVGAKSLLPATVIALPAGTSVKVQARQTSGSPVDVGYANLVVARL